MTTQLPAFELCTLLSIALVLEPDNDIELTKESPPIVDICEEEFEKEPVSSKEVYKKLKWQLSAS